MYSLNSNQKVEITLGLSPDIFTEGNSHTFPFACSNELAISKELVQSSVITTGIVRFLLRGLGGNPG